MTLTAAQLTERLTGIGASDAAAAMGLSQWKTPLELYLDKTGELDAANDPVVGNELMYWGSKLEAMIAEGWSEKTGIKVRRVNAQLTHPKHDFMIAHLDRRQVGSGRPLECKNVNVYYARNAFGEEGTDDVPDHYLIQVHHQIIIARAKWGADGAELAALIGGNNLRTYTFQHDAELEELIIKREAEFWQHVIDRSPPPPTTLGDLEFLYAEDNGEIKAVTDPEIVKRWNELHELKASSKVTLKAIKDIELLLKLDIAEAAGIKVEDPLDGPDGAGISYAGKTLATWKTQTRKSYTVPESTFRVLRLTKP